MVDNCIFFEHQLRVINLCPCFCDHTAIWSHLVQLLLKYCLLHFLNRPFFILILVENWVQFNEAINHVDFALVLED